MPPELNNNDPLNMPERVVQIIPHESYLLYLTSHGTVWRTLDPSSDQWEIMPSPMGKPTKELLKKKLHHAKGS